MTYSGQLEIIMYEAKAKLSDLVREHGEDSKFRNESVIQLKKVDDKVAFNLEGSRYLKEISVNELIDNEGYGYSANAMDAEKFLELVDHFVKKFETKKNCLRIMKYKD